MRKFYHIALIMTFIVTSLFLPLSGGENSIVHAAATNLVDISSNDTAQIHYQYINLADYPLTASTANPGWWPWSWNCTGYTKNKTLPWLPDRTQIYGSGTSNGNNMADYRDCPTGAYDFNLNTNNTFRAIDGGSYVNTQNDLPRAWIPSDLVGNWSSRGALSTWGNALVPSLNVLTNNDGDCTAADTGFSSGGDQGAGICSPWFTDDATFAGGGKTNNILLPDNSGHYYNVIWGMNHRYGYAAAEKATEDQYTAMYKRMNPTTTYPDNYTFMALSSGTTLFREEFPLDSASIDNIDSVDLNVRADDFVNVYLDGVSIHERYLSNKEAGVVLHDTYSGLSNTATIRSILKNALASDGSENTGTHQHVLAFQVNDKAVWAPKSRTNGVDQNNAAGLSYTFKMAKTTPDASTGFTCKVNPVGGTAPLVATVSLSNVTNIPSGTNINYDFNLANASDSAAKFPRDISITKIYYTYPSKGTYTVTATTAATGTKQCGSVTVTAPNSSSGGEVAP